MTLREFLEEHLGLEVEEESDGISVYGNMSDSEYDLMVDTEDIDEPLTKVAGLRYNHHKMQVILEL